MTTPVFTPEDAAKLIAFLAAAGDLKDTHRSAHTNAGNQESTAEHSWRLALLVIALEPYLANYDVPLMLKMAVLHDLGEAVTGDVPAIHQTGDQAARQQAERDGLASLVAPLPKATGQSMQAIAAQYDAGQTPEAALMKGLDKLETLHQHATGKNPVDFDYHFNLSYGAKWTDNPALVRVLRKALDAMTQARADEQEC